MTPGLACHENQLSLERFCHSCPGNQSRPQALQILPQSHETELHQSYIRIHNPCRTSAQVAKLSSNALANHLQAHKTPGAKPCSGIYTRRSGFRSVVHSPQLVFGRVGEIRSSTCVWTLGKLYDRGSNNTREEGEPSQSSQTKGPWPYLHLHNSRSVIYVTTNNDIWVTES
jgi:hypothetical protein